MSTCFTGENAKDESERRSFYSPLHRVTWGHMGSSKGDGEGGGGKPLEKREGLNASKLKFILLLNLTLLSVKLIFVCSSNSFVVLICLPCMQFF